APAGHPETAEPSDGAAGDVGAGAPPERPAETTMELLIPAQSDPAAPAPPSSAARQASPRDTEQGTAAGAGTRTTGTEPSGSGRGPDVAAAHPATAEAETARPGAGHEPASEIPG
ncbi:hypothetical protein AB8O53_35810, partial [Streptomyces pilosus]